MAPLELLAHEVNYKPNSHILNSNEAVETALTGRAVGGTIAVVQISRSGVRKILIGSAVVAVIAIVFTIWADRTIARSAAPYCYSSVESIPANRVGLLLGTAKFLKSGRINVHYTVRIDACEALYKAGKIEYILVSGDNSRKTYDEPTTFKNDLIARGIPAEKITLDYAGFRTLDSVVRVREIFGQTKFTVISQRFHNERAIYLAREKGIDAVGFDAADVGFYSGFKTKLREKFARVAAICDLYVFHTQPKFLGPQVGIGS